MIGLGCQRLRVRVHYNEKGLAHPAASTTLTVNDYETTRPGTGRESSPCGRSRKERIRSLQAEIGILRRRLNMERLRTVDDWLELPPDLRDALAAVALYRMLGDQTSALRLLGFVGDGRQLAKTKALVFGASGVARIVHATCLAEIDEAKHETLPRLYRSVRYGDDETAVRAAELLARLLCWPAPNGAEPAQAMPPAPRLLAELHEPEPDLRGEVDASDLEAREDGEERPAPTAPGADRTEHESFEAAFNELAGNG